jgi:hypothetical protein
LGERKGTHRISDGEGEVAPTDEVHRLAPPPRAELSDPLTPGAPFLNRGAIPTPYNVRF